MELHLRPKNILIIGGGSGIGLATAERLIKEDISSIIIASRNIEKLNDSKKKLESLKKPNQNIFAVSFDISNIKSHISTFDLIQDMIGHENKLDGLVISSGVNFDGSNWKGFNISEEDYDKVMNINLKGVFFIIRNFSNYLFNKGVRGNICVVSSISAHRDMLSVYQISKQAVSGIVHAYGKYLFDRGIVLNCVEPGPVHTDMMKYLAQYTDGVNPGKPWPENAIKRTIRSEEIAEIIYFLMTEMGETLSGTCILAGGGTKALFK